MHLQFISKVTSMNRKLLVRGYTEQGYADLPNLRLAEPQYSQALTSLVPACTDIVPIDVENGVIYLARRATKPMVGWWWLGGRMFAGETTEEAVTRCFRRETGLIMPPDRFRLVAVLDYRWRNRAQAPQETGCHTLAYTHVVSLSDEELAAVSAQLDTEEFRPGEGLVAFDRQRLVAADVFPAVLDLYDHLLPVLQGEIETGTLELVSSDARRDIREHGFGDASFQEFVVKDGDAALGKHYHRRKHEIFCFLEGGGTLLLASVDGSGRMVGDQRSVEVGPGSIIRIPPYCYHEFHLRRGTRFFGYSPRPFEQDDLVQLRPSS